MKTSAKSGNVIKNKNVTGSTSGNTAWKRSAPSNPDSNLEDSVHRYKEFLKTEKSIEVDVYMQNLEKISNCRFYVAVLTGCLSGTLCLTGLYGIGFYLFISLLFSLLLAVSVQIKKGTFFVSFTNVLTHGIFTQIMVYVIFWVMFYNLVHIY